MKKKRLTEGNFVKNGKTLDVADFRLSLHKYTKRSKDLSVTKRPKTVDK